jgi:pyridoxamine 5'-phosphate oxidase
MNKSTIQKWLSWRPIAELEYLIHEIPLRNHKLWPLMMSLLSLLGRTKLRRRDLSTDPFDQFSKWFAAARKCRRIALPEALCLSTIDAEGFPDARLVLLKNVSRSGFVFYTNLDSPKAKELSVNPKASLNFHWEPLVRQVRVRGKVEIVTDAEADAYFRTRPRLSQIGAWASHQSEVLEKRDILDKRVLDFIARFNGMEVPRPANWSGFRLLPDKIEFWQARPNRLHDRFLYTKQQDGTWKIERLSP